MKRILMIALFLMACVLIVVNPAWPIPPFPPKTGAGTGDMTKATYDADANSKIDANKVDDLSATYMPVGWISRAGTNNVLTYTGNYSLGLTLSNNTALTLPTSGTLATTTLKPSDLAISSQAAGDVLYFDGTNWVRLAKDSGKYLKSGASAVSWDTPTGAAHDALTLGTTATDILGLSTQELGFDTQTANYVLAGPTTGAAAAPTFRVLVSGDIPNNAADTSGNAGTATALAADPADCAAGSVATAINASGTLTCGKAIGTDIQTELSILKGTYTDTYLCKYTASGTLLDCNVDPAGFQTQSDILDGLAVIDVSSPNNKIFGYNNAGELGAYANHSHDDSAAQFYSATASKGTMRYLLSGSTDGKLLTVEWNHTDNKTLKFPDPTTGDSVTYGSAAIRLNTGGTTARIKTITDSATTLADVDGALGTPSFTALNMPTSNADPGTTAGQIKHDSTDTGSNSGGTAKWYDGAQVRSLVDTGTNYTLITKTEYLPIRYAEDGTTGPAAAAEISTSTAIGRGFDKDADEDVVFWWVTPNDYVGGIKYRVIYALGADATADDTAVFSMAGCAAANSATLACTPGTAVTLADELGTDDDQYQVMVSDYSTAVTVTDIAAGSLNRLVFLRDISEDDYTEGDLLVIGVEIKYQAKIIGIAGY